MTSSGRETTARDTTHLAIQSVKGVMDLLLAIARYVLSMPIRTMTHVSVIEIGKVKIAHFMSGNVILTVWKAIVMGQKTAIATTVQTMLNSMSATIVYVSETGVE